jgi:hypothetical protein
MKTSRRAFLKFFIGGIAVASCPIPKFLLPKEPSIFPDKESVFEGYGSKVAFDTSGGILTQEMIENAALQAARNMGQPDRIYMSKKVYKAVAKQFGFKVVYEGDEIIHYAL